MAMTHAHRVVMLLSGFFVLGAANPVPSPEPPQRPTAQGEVARPVTQVREGSLLHREQVDAPAPDLRTPWERERDHLVSLHVDRVARLDVIASLASAAEDVALQERVDDVRRKELQDFYEQVRALQTRARLPVLATSDAKSPPDASALTQVRYRDALARARAVITADDAADRLADIEHEVESARVHRE